MSHIAGEVRGPTRPQEKPMLRPIPLSHTGYGPRHPPFARTFPMWPWPSSDPGTALPLPPRTRSGAQSNLRQFSKENPPTGGSYTDTAAIFPRKYFRAGGGANKMSRALPAPPATRAKGEGPPASQVIDLRVLIPREARRCLRRHSASSSADEKLTPEQEKRLPPGLHQTCFYH